MGLSAISDCMLLSIFFNDGTTVAEVEALVLPYPFEGLRGFASVDKDARGRGTSVDDAAGGAAAFGVAFAELEAAFYAFEAIIMTTKHTVDVVGILLDRNHMPPDAADPRARDGPV